MATRNLGNLRERVPLHVHSIVDELEASAQLDNIDDVDEDIVDINDSIEELSAYPRNNLLIRDVSAEDHYVVPRTEIILANAIDNAITIHLPPILEAYDLQLGRQLIIKKIDSTANVVTIDANESETIDGATTQTLTSQYDTIRIVCNGLTWYII